MVVNTRSVWHTRGRGQGRCGVIQINKQTQMEWQILKARHKHAYRKCVVNKCKQQHHNAEEGRREVRQGTRRCVRSQKVKGGRGHKGIQGMVNAQGTQVRVIPCTSKAHSK